jgi:plasmid stabilization system protein ParE
VIPYKFSGRARRDASLIIGRLHLLSPALADKFEQELFITLEELSRLNGAGYRRPELTTKDVLFYKVPPYLLVFRKQTKLLIIIRILHSASDLTRQLN